MVLLPRISSLSQRSVLQICLAMIDCQTWVWEILTAMRLQEFIKQFWHPVANTSCKFFAKATWKFWLQLMSQDQLILIPLKIKVPSLMNMSIKLWSISITTKILLWSKRKLMRQMCQLSILKHMWWSAPNCCRPWIIWSFMSCWLQTIAPCFILIQFDLKTKKLVMLVNFCCNSILIQF